MREAKEPPGTLCLVATPIGNLGDISARAVSTLEGADFIAAEDTRVTLRLLNHLKIKKPLMSYHEHNRASSGERIVARILSGEDCALVTDAGLPGISDPGQDLVRLCAESGVRVIVVPGPCAAVAALALSGFSGGRFTFEGFLSTSRKSRAGHLASLKSEKRAMVFYEAPHKLLRTLKDMHGAFGDRRVSISRELTKLHEETLRMSLSEAEAYFGQAAPRGEFVLVVEGMQQGPAEETGMVEAVDAARAYIDGGLSVKDSVKAAAEKTGVSKNELYRELMGLMHGPTRP